MGPHPIAGGFHRIFFFCVDGQHPVPLGMALHRFIVHQPGLWYFAHSKVFHNQPTLDTSGSQVELPFKARRPETQSVAEESLMLPVLPKRNGVSLDGFIREVLSTLCLNTEVPTQRKEASFQSICQQ